MFSGWGLLLIKKTLISGKTSFTLFWLLFSGKSAKKTTPRHVQSKDFVKMPSGKLEQWRLGAVDRVFDLEKNMRSLRDYEIMIAISDSDT